jgi:PAS domain S-box-containing protein
MSDPRPRDPSDVRAHERSWNEKVWAGYALAAAAVAVSALLTYALRFALSSPSARVTFAFFYLAVFVSAWFGGRGPALFSIALSVFVADLLFLPNDLFAPDLSGIIPNLFFIGISLMAVFLLERSRRAEREAREARGSLETTLKSIGDAVISTDASGRVVFMNPVAERLTGWTLLDARGQALPEVFRIVNEQTRETVESPVEKVLREGGIVGLANHTVLLARDGREIPIDDSGAPINDAHGHTTGVVLVFHDITERKLAEAERSFLAAIVESSQDAVIGKTLDGTITSWNETAERVYGYTVEEAVGRHISLVVPEDCSVELEEIMSRLRHGERIEHVETVRVTKDGKRKDVLLTISPIRDASGRWVGASTVARDITERKAAEERLRFVAEASRVLASSLDYEATLERFARLSVASLADYCLIDLADADGTVRRVAASHADPARQPLVERLREYPPDGARAAGVASVIRTGEPLVVNEVNEEALASMTRNDEHARILRELGLKSFVAVPLVARGRTIGALTFASTRVRRDYMAEDVSYAQEIASRAALAIENSRLYKRAQEVNRAKDEFLATLSHELRTPLTPILGWTHMIRSGRLNEVEVGRGVRVIEKNSESLSRLINDLLDMSSILSGKMRLEREPVELSSVVRQAIETVRPQADARGVALEAALGGATATVSGDRTRLVQVFWNLLNNAVKFSPEGGRVRVSLNMNGGRETSVNVEDEGEGITPDFLPHVFERFRQADMGTTREHGGLGIGLALVKSFVEAHGGAVRAASAGAGRGSRFTVTLPALVDEAAARETGDLINDGEIPCVEEVCHVLLVEDAPDTLDMLRVVFESRGYGVTPCADAEEALRVAESERFDIIVSDIGLPIVDGYELISRLRDIEHMREVPAIALTGYAAPRDAEAALAAGFDAHVAKPVDPSALLEQVEQLMQRKVDGA